MDQPDVNAAAEPSAAAPVVENPSFNASDQYTWSPEQREHWNKTGNPPDQPTKQDSAPASSPEKKVTPENAAEAGAAPKQDKTERKPGEKLSAEERISQLTSKVHRLEEEARERSRTPEPKPASEAQAQPATYGEWRKQFKPSEWLEKWTAANPQGTYDDANASMADHLYDVRRAFENAEVRQREMAQQAQESMRKAKEKHGDAEDRIKQAIGELFAKAPDFVKAFVNDSEITVDLLYALSEPGALQKVLETARTSPGKALRQLRDMELAAEKEISKPEVNESKPELKPRAPKPPAEVGGRGSPPEDALISAARANDFRSFEAEQNRRMTASS